MTNTPKFAVLPMWAMENIRAELRLRPGTWPAIDKAVECADVPDLLPCDVKVAPATVFLKGTPVHTLLMALEKRHRIPVPVATFPAHDGGHIAGWLDAKRNDFLSVKDKEKTERMAITEPGAFDRFTQPLVHLEAYDAVRSRLELTELARGGDAIEIEGLKALNDQLRGYLDESKKAYAELEEQLGADVKAIDDLRAKVGRLEDLLRDVWTHDIGTQLKRRIKAEVEPELTSAQATCKPGGDEQ